jgi:hypothetical protein
VCIFVLRAQRVSATIHRLETVQTVLQARSTTLAWRENMQARVTDKAQITASSSSERVDTTVTATAAPDDIQLVQEAIAALTATSTDLDRLLDTEQQAGELYYGGTETGARRDLFALHSFLLWDLPVMVHWSTWCKRRTMHIRGL